MHAVCGTNVQVNIGDYILAINDIGIDDKEVHEIEQLSESVRFSLVL